MYISKIYGLVEHSVFKDTIRAYRRSLHGQVKRFGFHLSDALICVCAS